MSIGGHARDSDAIAGDNAQIFRIVGTNGVAVDAERVPHLPLRQLRRARSGSSRAPIQLLDYTQGGPASKPTAAASDRGLADEIHGEGGDDFVYGMRGNDVLFGEGQDDDLIGGYGDDWISGGTGDDGVIGDDGRISTSRNSSLGYTWSNATASWIQSCSGNAAGTCYSEPLNGIAALLADRPGHADEQRQRPERAHLHPGPHPGGDRQRRRRRSTSRST